MKRIIYVSRLMKGWEAKQACAAFREQEAVIRRKKIAVAATTTR